MSIRDEISQAAFDESVRIRRKALLLTPRGYASGGPILRNTETGEHFIPVGQAAMSGAHVIQSRGLADGYEPPSASLDPPPVRTRAAERARAASCGQTVPFLGATPLEAAENLRKKLGHCPHGEAEEVRLITGEVVGAVCPTCWETLPPSFMGSAWKP